MIYILYNPHSGDRRTREKDSILQLEQQYNTQKIDITQISDYSEFCSPLTEDDTLILCGGDGTINQFVNRTKDVEIKADILYAPLGTGNDLARDLNKNVNDEPFSIKHVLKNLPTAVVQGKTYYFLNNVGFGIDGYCCEQGDIKKQKSTKPVDYTAIAIKGLLYDFKARNATITVDGKVSKYHRVWIACTLKGRYYGGGMLAAPNQDRFDENKTLSLVVIHKSRKLKTLIVFPKIFKGEHVKHTDMVDIQTGHEISVKFDRPTPLQIDGETFLDVTTYTAKA